MRLCILIMSILGVVAGNLLSIPICGITLKEAGRGSFFFVFGVIAWCLTEYLFLRPRDYPGWVIKR